MEERFQKKKLNRYDHKKMENVAKYVKKGGVILGALTTCVIADEIIYCRVNSY